jgi:hypothetical protein
MGTRRAQFRKSSEDGMIGAPIKLLKRLVPEERLELSQGCPYRILSPARLPFHHSGTAVLLITKHYFGYKRTM